MGDKRPQDKMENNKTAQSKPSSEFLKALQELDISEDISLDQSNELESSTEIIRRGSEGENISRKTVSFDLDPQAELDFSIRSPSTFSLKSKSKPIGIRTKKLKS